MRDNFSSLRSRILAQWQPVPEEFTQRLQGNPHYGFLLNPAGCQPFLYLSQLVSEVSQQWFDRPPSQLRVLDWGCGKGQVSYLLKQPGFEVVGADVPEGQSDRTLLELAGLPLVALEHPYLLPFAESSFEVVLSFGVLEHVPDDQASLGEIRRVLKPGGLFFCFNLPQTTSWIMRLAHLQGNHYHDRLYSAPQVRAMLQEAQLRPLDMWRRQLFPKNRVRYPAAPWFEKLDQWLCRYTPLSYLATSLEFIATTNQQ